MYGLRLFIVVLEKLQINMPILLGLQISTSSQSFVSKLCPVFEIREKQNKMKNCGNELL